MAILDLTYRGGQDRLQNGGRPRLESDTRLQLGLQGCAAALAGYVANLQRTRLANIIRLSTSKPVAILDLTYSGGQDRPQNGGRPR